MIQNNTQSIGIIVELENVESAGEERAVRGLKLLQEQFCEIPDPYSKTVELIIVYDSEIFSGEGLAKFIEKTGLENNQQVKIQAIGRPNIHYYDHKNIGSKACSSDIILFFDCDILIESGWLENMLSPFDDDDVHFVSGCSHIETPRLADKIYALTDPGFPLENKGWSIEERGGAGARSLSKVEVIMANAFAYRASQLEGDLFPKIDAYRGHCGVASRWLKQKGETLYAQPNAVARHPSQESFADYFARAFAEGCDAIQISRFNNAPGLRGAMMRSLLGSFYRLVRGNWGLLKRSFTRFQDVSLHPVAIPLVLAIGSFYFATRFAGEVATLINSKLALRLSIGKVTL